MKTITKTFLKEDEGEDEIKKGDEIWFKKDKGTVLFTSDYIITAEFIKYTWKEKLMKFINGKSVA